MSNEGSTKLCPHCSGEIAVAATRCKHCFKTIEGPDTPLWQSGNSPSMPSTAAMSPHEPAVPTEEASEFVVMARHRYQDGYASANYLISFGGLIKTVGVLAGVGLGGVALLVAANSHSAVAAFVGIAVGLILGITTYAMGVLVSGQGQILLATLDVAVGALPLVSSKTKADIIRKS